MSEWQRKRKKRLCLSPLPIRQSHRGVHTGCEARARARRPQWPGVVVPERKRKAVKGQGKAVKGQGKAVEGQVKAVTGSGRSSRGSDVLGDGG